jgi:hypothetical protein
MRCNIVANGKQHYVYEAKITKFYDEDVLELTCGAYASDDDDMDTIKRMMEMGWMDENT